MLRRSLNAPRSNRYARLWRVAQVGNLRTQDSILRYPFLTVALRSRFNPVVSLSEQLETIKWHGLQSVESYRTASGSERIEYAT
jgi:hypothetical protein